MPKNDYTCQAYMRQCEIGITSRLAQSPDELRLFSFFYREGREVRQEKKEFFALACLRRGLRPYSTSTMLLLFLIYRW